MNHYQSKAPRALLGFAAIAMAAITISAMVIVPAKLDAATVAGVAVAAAVTCHPEKEKS